MKEVEIELKTLFPIIILAAMLWQGCGKDLTAERIGKLRAAGEVDSAYAEAVSALSDNARRDNVWREFVRVCVERTRRMNAEGAEPNLAYLVQAGIVCAAVREHARGRLNADWREVSQMAAREIERQLSLVLNEFGRQQRTAQQVVQLRKFPRSDRRNALVLQQTEETLEEYRRSAGDLIKRRAVLEYLYERLPETSGGTKTSLREQLRVTIEQWQQMLELEAGSDAAITEAAETIMEKAMQRAKGDFRELGYLLPNTVIENGVYE